MTHAVGEHSGMIDDMSARMFAAVVPPAEQVERLEEFIGPRRDSDTRLRWSLADQWHITVLFAERVSDRCQDRLVEGLAEVAGRTPRFVLRCAGAGCFPDPSAAKVLYLPVQLGDEPLAHLSKSARAAASRAGVEPDGSRFVPHLTVARCRVRLEATKWLRVLGAFPGLDWEASELQLIVSHLGEGQRGRPRYEVLERFPFASRR